MSVIFKSGKWTVIDNVTSRVVSKHNSRQEAREANAAWHDTSKKKAPAKSAAKAPVKPTTARKEPELSLLDEFQIMAANLKLAIDKFVRDATIAVEHHTPQGAPTVDSPTKRKIFGRNDGTWDIYLGGKYKGSARDIESARLGMRYLKTLGYLPEQDIFYQKKR